MNSIEIGKIIKFHRKSAGLNQKALADLAGVGKTVVFDIEKGKATIKYNTLLKILDVLNIKIELTGPLMDNYNLTINEKS